MSRTPIPKSKRLRPTSLPATSSKPKPTILPFQSKLQPSKPPTPTPDPSKAPWFSTWPRWKRYTVTGLFAGTIITGAVWGAMLKMRQEAKAEQRKQLEATTDEKVAILEARKERLNGMRGELQGKIDALHAKMKAREGITSGKDL